MAFQFSLAAVLRMRQIAEEREEQTLTSILNEIAQAAHAIERLDTQIARSRNMRENEVGTRIVANELQSSYGRLRELEEARNHFEEQVRGFERLRDQQMKIYQAAHGARLLLSEMRSDQRDLYDVARARQAQKTLDDLFLARRKRS